MHATAKKAERPYLNNMAFSLSILLNNFERVRAVVLVSKQQAFVGSTGREIAQVSKSKSECAYSQGVTTILYVDPANCALLLLYLLRLQLF